MKNLIKQLYNNGLTYQAIAEKFGISRQRIHQIVTGYKSFAQIQTKNIVGKIDNRYICRRCKRRADCIHHFDGNFRNNSIKNLIPLCTSCHYFVHAVKTLIDEKILSRSIYKLLKKGMVYSEITEKTGLTKYTISTIVRRNNLWDKIYPPKLV